MKPDFSGWATKAGIVCSDGRTIMPGAFEHQDKERVPLVWQHGHDDPENVLGYAILEHHAEGVRTHAFFNDTAKAQIAKQLVLHGDITKLSIWANKLMERSKRVLHGAIREVSLVLGGANPGAIIDPISIQHDDGSNTELEDEAIIHTGLDIEIESDEETDDSNQGKQEDASLGHADGTSGDSEETVQDVYESLNEKQKTMLHFMIGEALSNAGDTQSGTAEHSDTTTDKDETVMKHNIFEQQGKAESKTPFLSHSDTKNLFEQIKKEKPASLGDYLSHYLEDNADTLKHGIENIDQLFPDHQLVNDTPEWVSRRMEWVDVVLSGVRKSPISKIKTLSADITHAEARAKGYIKGTLKREQFFSVIGRTTDPTTIYKKQKLDRDDMVDITGFDVVVWLKAEMRVMLDEELARAILIGDGRDIADEDKINEQCIRPVATDHELYTTTVYVNVDDANSDMNEVIDAFIDNRYLYKGTGQPTFFTTEVWIARFFKMRDENGRRIYRNLEDLALELRVKAVVPVEVMLDDSTLVGVMFNPVDYVLGATRGGQVSLFDDFDIDYNQQKYLIETRCSGALVKVKSAMAFRATAGTNVLATPEMPDFDAETGELTIPTVTGVTYKHGATTLTTGGSPYSVDPGTTWTVTATAATGYYFATSEGDSWDFTADA